MREIAAADECIGKERVPLAEAVELFAGAAMTRWCGC